MHEIAAITGHASVSEVQRYTNAADQSGSHYQQWKKPDSEHLLSNSRTSFTILAKDLAKSKCDLKDGGPGRTETLD